MGNENQVIGHYVTFLNKITNKRELLSNTIFPTYSDAANYYLTPEATQKMPPGSSDVLVVNAYAEGYQVSSDEADRVSRSDYFNTVRDAAQGIYDDWHDGSIGDDRESLLDHIHEYCDGHQQVIYTDNAIDTLRFSDNDSYGIDELGTDSFDFKDGIPWSQLAFWAFKRDIEEQLDAMGLDLNDPKRNCKGCDAEVEPSDLDSEGMCEDCQLTNLRYWEDSFCEDCGEPFKNSELTTDGVCINCQEERDAE